MSIEPPTDPTDEEEYTGDGPYDDEEWLAEQRKEVQSPDRTESGIEYTNRMMSIPNPEDDLTLKDKIEIIEDQWNTHMDEEGFATHEFVILDWQGQAWGDNTSLSISGYRPALIALASEFIREGYHVTSPQDFSRDGADTLVVGITPQ
jgi:hypothetical protein